MKTTFLKLLTLLLVGMLTLFADPSFAQRKSRGDDVYVKPYTRKDGTFVDGYMRSSPDSTRSNNFSTKGNINPYTGKLGTKRNSDDDLYTTGSGGSGISGPKLKGEGLLGVRLGVSLLDYAFLRKYYQQTLSYGLSFFNNSNLNTSTFLSVDIEGIYSQKDGRQSRSDGLLLSCRQTMSNVCGSRLYLGAGYGLFQSVDDFKTDEYDGPAHAVTRKGHRFSIGVVDKQGGMIELGYNKTNARGTEGYTIQFGFRF